MTHRRVSVRSVLIVGRGSIRRRFARIISVSVVIALALCALAVVKGINDLGDRVSDDVNVSYLDSDLITLYYPRTANQGYLETPFDDDEVVNGLRVKYGFREIVPVYMMNEPWLISRGSRTCEGVVKQVNIDEFFEQRIMSFDIEGRFPESDDEIILAEDAAEMLFDGECIGGKVMLNDGMGSGVEMTVVGVNRTVNPFDKVYSVVSSGKVRELVVKQLDFALENRMELYAFKDESDFQEIQVDTGGIYGKMSEVTGSEVIVRGRLPESDEEILISSAVLPYAFDTFDVPVGDGDIELLAGKDIALKHNGLFKVRIAGVYEEESGAQDEGFGMKFMPSLVGKLREVGPVALEAYLPASADVSAVKRRIEAEDGLQCSLQLESLKMNVLRQTAFFKWSLLLAGVILAVISIAMLGSFSKLSVLERKKEIAIIKSLGASDMEVLMILWFDSVCISVISAVMAAGVTFAFAEVVPFMIPEFAFAEFGFPMKTLIMLSGVFFAMVLVFTFFGMRRLIRTMPAELMRGG